MKTLAETIDELATDYSYSDILNSLAHNAAKNHNKYAAADKPDNSANNLAGRFYKYRTTLERFSRIFEDTCP